MPFFGGLNNYKIRGSNNYGGTSAAANLSTGVDNLILGNQAGFSVITGSYNVILGTDAESLDDISSGIGIGAAVSVGRGSVAIGTYFDDVEGLYTTAADGVGAVAIGLGATAFDNASVALGWSSSAAAASVAIGSGANTGDNGAVSIGQNSSAGLNGVALGHTAVAFGDGLALGDGAEASAGQIAVGTGVIVSAREAGTVALNGLIFQPTAGATLPSGTTAQRDAAPAGPLSRFNTDLGCIELYDPILAKWVAFNRQIDFSATVAAAGTTTAGAGTYTNREGFATLNGDICTFAIRLGWSAHTGTGNLKVTGLPFLSNASGFTAVTNNVNGLALTAGSSPQAYIAANSDEITISQQGAGTAAVVAMDAVVTYIMLSGSYRIQLP